MTNRFADVPLEVLHHSPDAIYEVYFLCGGRYSFDEFYRILDVKEMWR